MCNERIGETMDTAERLAAIAEHNAAHKSTLGDLEKLLLRELSPGDLGRIGRENVKKIAQAAWARRGQKVA